METHGEVIGARPFIVVVRQTGGAAHDDSGWRARRPRPRQWLSLRKGVVVTFTVVKLVVALTLGLVAAPLAADAQQAGKVLPWDPAPRRVIVELQQALAHASERFQAMDEAGVLSHVSDHYRTDPLTKATIREQLRVMFALYDTLRAQVRIDAARTAGDQAWVYSTGEVSGRLRWLGTWTPILAWQHEPEVARREQGVWRLYGYQQ